MKKNFLTCGLLLSSILLYSYGTTAYADDATSNANTTVTAGDGTGDLIDQNVKPPTNSSGPLTIDAVSSFNFGTIKVGTKSKAADTSNGEKLGVQVRDVRGTGAGWALNVKVGTFTNTTDSTKTLSASVSIPKGTVSNGVDSTQGVIAKAVVLNQSYANIMNAPKDTGMGRWLDTFESTTDKVTLQDIAQNAYAGSYTATMNWQLVDAPS